MSHIVNIGPVTLSVVFVALEQSNPVNPALHWHVPVTVGNGKFGIKYYVVFTLTDIDSNSPQMVTHLLHRRTLVKYNWLT